MEFENNKKEPVKMPKIGKVSKETPLDELYTIRKTGATYAWKYLRALTFDSKKECLEVLSKIPFIEKYNVIFDTTTKKWYWKYFKDVQFTEKEDLYEHWEKTKK